MKFMQTLILTHKSGIIAMSGVVVDEHQLWLFWKGNKSFQSAWKRNLLILEWRKE